MSQLKAFVGHSFTSEDEDVVRAFLKIFDQIKGMNIGFTWEHAEAAEPKVLAEKVLRLIEDKNLFIGICTSKEAAIQPSGLRKGVFKKKVLKGDEAQFSLKTSDWIIQEIGLAIGRGMDLILLVERDVRQPGGLQGNLEYITFERDAPERSYCKILEMIQALLPKAKVRLVEDVSIRTAPEEKPELHKQETIDGLQPEEDWSRRRYEIAYMRMISSDHPEGAKRISDAYLATEEGKISENRVSWEAFQEYIRIWLGKEASLTRLEQLAKEYPKNSDVQEFLAMGYREYDENEKAAQCFNKAAESTKDISKKIDRYGQAAISFAKAGSKSQADATIITLKVLAPQIENGEALLVGILRHVTEHEADEDLFIGLMERLLTHRPDDIESRFSLAYKYSQKKQDDLSLLHYLKIPYQLRGAGAWNNVGVEFDHFGLANKSVKAYRKAEELGETLAMCNLAQKLVKEGFLDEAQTICDRALKVEDYHKNVGDAISRIKEVPSEEDKKEKELIEKAVPISEFYRDYGQAAIKEDVKDIVGRWHGPDCELQVTIKDGIFTAEGRYERLGFGLAYALGASITAPPGSVKYHVAYEGKVYGRAAKCIFRRQEENQPAASGALRSAENKDVLMILSETLSEIRVYEKNASPGREFYKLTRAQ